MKSTFLLWGSAVSSCLSSAWVLLLVALIIRCKLSPEPFPVLAKFSHFHNHILITDRMLQTFPILALLAVTLLGAAWYFERRFSMLRSAVFTVAGGLLLSGLTITLNPGGYLSWFLS